MIEINGFQLNTVAQQNSKLTNPLGIVLGKHRFITLPNPTRERNDIHDLKAVATKSS